jgi:hypothetical protein
MERATYSMYSTLIIEVVRFFVKRCKKNVNFQSYSISDSQFWQPALCRYLGYNAILYSYAFKRFWNIRIRVNSMPVSGTSKWTIQFYCYVQYTDWSTELAKQRNRSRDISVGILTRLWAGRPRTPGSFSGSGKTFLFSLTFRLALRPNLLLIQGKLWAVSLGVKRQGRAGDHSQSSSVEVKDRGAIPPLRHTFSWPGA